jgi:flagellar biosynthesis protein
MATKPEIAAEVVALGYDRGQDSAPRMVAKGSGYIGEKILEIARQHHIPLYQDPQLTRLLSRVELGDEVPESLYKAVAQVILFAWELSEQQSSLDHPTGTNPPPEQPPQEDSSSHIEKQESEPQPGDGC